MIQDDIKRHLEMFEYFGIPATFTYKESVDALIELHYDLLRKKVRREKDEFRARLREIVEIPN